MLHPENVPQELQEIPQWICWKRYKGAKTPCSMRDNGKFYACNWKDPEYWLTFEDAVKTYLEDHRGEAELEGIGLVMTRELGLVGIDLDGVTNPDNAGVDSYAELSPSGNGVRIFAWGTDIEVSRHPEGVGIFTHDRWLSVTGNSIGSISWVADCTTEIRMLMNRVLEGDINHDKLNRLMHACRG